jgi:hypothetical protein
MQLDFQQLLRRLERIIDDLKYVLKEINQHLFSRLVNLVSIYVYTFDWIVRNIAYTNFLYDMIYI